MMFSCEQAFGKTHQLLEKMVAFAEQASKDGKRIDLLEREVFSRLLEIGRETLKGFIALAGDGNEGQTVQQEEQVLKRFEGKRRRVYRSIFGVIEIDRWVYGVRERQKAIYLPLDQRLGLPAGEQSYVLEDWMQRFCVQNAFSHAVTSLDDLLGIKTSMRTAERINREVSTYVESHRQASEKLPHEEQEILVTTADGKGVPMCRTLEEQMGKDDPAWRRHQQKKQQAKAADRATKRLGRGQKKTRKQMAYVGAVYTISPWRRSADDILDELLRKDKKVERPRPTNKRVWAELTRYREGERWDGQPRLFSGLALEADRRDPEGTKPLVCLMDGQRSLWNMKKQWLPRAVGILDIFHVTEWLWKAAYCFHREGSREAEALVTHYLRMFLEGKVSYAIGSLQRKSNDLGGAKQATLEKVLRYFRNNQQYMRYDEYLSAGYPIGSGVVEGACRHLVRDRLEQSGMRWDVNGAQAMLDTRSTYVNGDWQTFIEHRIQTEQAQLYRQAA